MPTVGSTLMLDRLGPKRQRCRVPEIQLEAPEARFLVLADLKPVIRSNAQRTEAKLAWFSNQDLTNSASRSPMPYFWASTKPPTGISPWL